MSWAQNMLDRALTDAHERLRQTIPPPEDSSMSATADLERERTELGLQPNGDPPETEEEMFPSGTLDGDGINLKNLVKAGKPVQYTRSLLKGEVPGQKELSDPASPGRAVVTYEVAEVVVVILREEGEITGYKIREKLRPTYTERLAF